MNLIIEIGQIYKAKLVNKRVIISDIKRSDHDRSTIVYRSLLEEENFCQFFIDKHYFSLYYALI